MKRWLILGALLMMSLASCAQPQGSVSTAALPDGVRPDLNPHLWLTAQGQIHWPPNDGFSATPVPEILPPGTLVDRFGSDYGSFFSPAGAAYGKRALPYVCRHQAYTIYRVAAPLPVWVGRAAPWFDQQGGATQFETDATAARMIRESVLVPIERDAPDVDAPDRPCNPPPG